MNVQIEQLGPLRGNLEVPGDKAIAHRALMLAACAPGQSTLKNVPQGADVGSTISVLRQLGIEIDRDGPKTKVHGQPIETWSAPTGSLDCGNSGTTMRLLSGLLTGQQHEVCLTGDSSLRKRPMQRVAQPLCQLGANIQTAAQGRAPIWIMNQPTEGGEIELQVPSAQVKSALLFAGLNAKQPVTVHQPSPLRDHSENLFKGAGLKVSQAANSITVEPGTPQPFDLEIPGDPSSSAFIAVAAILIEKSKVTIENLSLNPTRTGYFEVLQNMGAKFNVRPQPSQMDESRGAVTFFHSALKGVSVLPEIVPSLIDEIPVLAVAAAFARGKTSFSGVDEMRIKETDRVAAVLEILGALGVEAQAGPGELMVHGGQPQPTDLTSFGDHRIALAGAVALACLPDTQTISGWEAADISYPGFLADLETLSNR